jgi:hypothetical protein
VIKEGRKRNKRGGVITDLLRPNMERNVHAPSSLIIAPIFLHLVQKNGGSNYLSRLVG